MKLVEHDFRWSLSAFLIAVISIATPGPARAVSNFCPSGTCDIATPVYVNVYWSANWNVAVATSSTPDMTTTRIDALTQSLINSAYFSGLQQYSVTSVAVLMPSIVEGNCGAPPGDLDTAHSQLGAFATCVIALNPFLNNGNTILNVFLPPQTAPIAGHDFCTKSNGEHDKYGSPVEVTFLPTNSSCNGSIKNSAGHDVARDGRGNDRPCPGLADGMEGLRGRRGRRPVSRYECAWSQLPLRERPVILFEQPVDACTVFRSSANGRNARTYKVSPFQSSFTLTLSPGARSTRRALPIASRTPF